MDKQQAPLDIDENYDEAYEEGAREAFRYADEHPHKILRDENEQQAPPDRVYLSRHYPCLYRLDKSSTEDVAYIPESTADAKVVEMEASLGKVLNELERLEIINHAMPVEDQVGIAISYALKWKELSETRSNTITALESQLATADARVVEAVRETWEKAIAVIAKSFAEGERVSSETQLRIFDALESAKEEGE